MSKISLLPQINEEFIERRIYLIRGRKVMVSFDLADLYQVRTKYLNKAVRRNRDRFPDDFMFKLTKEETRNLRFQIGTSSWGGSRYLPYAFTELGVGMLSSVLKGQRAVQMNIFIIRAFVKLRELLATHKELADKIGELEREQRKQGKDLDTVYSIVKRLIDQPERPKRKVGFSQT